MKRFEFILEIAKQLISVSSALIIAVSAFSTSLFEHEKTALIFSLIVLFLILQVLSIISGIFLIGSLVNQAEKAEKSDSFVSIHSNKWTWSLSLQQQLFFISAFIVFILAIVFDKGISPH